MGHIKTPHLPLGTDQQGRYPAAAPQPEAAHAASELDEELAQSRFDRALDWQWPSLFWTLYVVIWAAVLGVWFARGAA